MLNEQQIATYRARLLLDRAALDHDDADSAPDRETVTLDQQSVGRLSRMDAMQRQAMAQATSRRRAARRHRIDAALTRIDEAEFGFCQDCGEDIPPARLDLDPTAASCISCAKG